MDNNKNNNNKNNNNKNNNNKNNNNKNNNIIYTPEYTDNSYGSDSELCINETPIKICDNIHCNNKAIIFQSIKSESNTKIIHHYKWCNNCYQHAISSRKKEK